MTEIAPGRISHEGLISRPVFEVRNGGIMRYNHLGSAWIELGPNSIAAREPQRFLESLIVKTETPMVGDLPEPNFGVSLQIFVSNHEDFLRVRPDQITPSVEEADVPPDVRLVSPSGRVPLKIG